MHVDGEYNKTNRDIGVLLSNNYYLHCYNYINIWVCSVHTCSTYQTVTLYTH